MKRQTTNGTATRRISGTRSGNERVTGGERKTGGCARWKKLLSGAAGIIALLFLGVFLLWTAGIKPYVVLSGSMEPQIRTGSLCFIDTRAEYEQIREGDVIAFASPLGVLVAHRVVDVSEKGFTTKGDANDISDGTVTTKENFRGRTVFSIPCAGYVCHFLKQILQVFAEAPGHIL